MIVLILAGGRRRRPGRDRAAVLPALDHRAGGRAEALHAAAARRARHLRARGLLQLPLADDPAVPRRDAALRPLLGGRRVRLRPPVPVGQQAHRPRPAPRRRPLQRRVAPPAPDQPARPGARVEHAGLPVAGERSAVDPATSCRRSCARCARSACRTATPRSPAPPRRCRARPSWTRWSPTCRSLGTARRSEEQRHGRQRLLRSVVTLLRLRLSSASCVWAWRAARREALRRGGARCRFARRGSERDERLLRQRLVGLRRRRHGRSAWSAAWRC